jgi:hypothetical protein
MDFVLLRDVFILIKRSFGPSEVVCFSFRNVYGCSGVL